MRKLDTASGSGGRRPGALRRAALLWMVPFSAACAGEPDVPGGPADLPGQDISGMDIASPGIGATDTAPDTLASDTGAPDAGEGDEPDSTLEPADEGAPDAGPLSDQSAPAIDPGGSPDEVDVVPLPDVAYDELSVPDPGGDPPDGGEAPYDSTEPPDPGMPDPGCVPACAGKVCGPDGCGGTCPPGCPAGESCSGGKCGKTCKHSYGGVFADGGCSPAYQCCDGSWKKGNAVCGPCVCAETSGKIGCVPEDDVEPPPPPPPPAALSFVVYGDTQFATSSCTSGVPERLAVPKAIAALSPTFVLHTGDLMDHGYEDGAYAQFEKCSEAALSELVFFPTSGNHDMGSGAILDYKAYLQSRTTTKNAAIWGGGYGDAFQIAIGDDTAAYSTSFDSPGDKSAVPSGVSFETFYAVRHENVYVLSFEQGTRWWTNTPKPWVEARLLEAQADPSIDHIVVVMHHPMYSTTMPENAGGECIQPVRKHYEALFRKHGVRLVFSGHAHLYEHFFVPDDGSATKADPHPATYAAGDDAIHYIVTGGGGGPLNGCAAPKAELSLSYSQGRFCAYHVVEVQVAGKDLTVNVLKVAGSASSYTTEVADTFGLVSP